MTTSITWNGINLDWAYGNLLPMIFRRIHCKHLAIDVLHDSMIRFALAKNPQRFEQPEAYLHTIVKNLLVDQRQMQSVLIPLDTQVEPTDGNIPAHGVDIWGVAPSAEQLLDIQQRLQLLQRIIDGLPSKAREVFWMFRIEGLPQKTIAEQMNISVNMVERHIIRALVDLRAAKALILAQ